MSFIVFTLNDFHLQCLMQAIREMMQFRNKGLPTFSASAWTIFWNIAVYQFYLHLCSISACYIDNITIIKLAALKYAVVQILAGICIILKTINISIMYLSLTPMCHTRTDYSKDWSLITGMSHSVRIPYYCYINILQIREVMKSYICLLIWTII